MDPAIAPLVKWPATPEEMTPELMARIVGYETQIAWLKKWREMDSPTRDHEREHAYRMQAITGVGLLLALATLMKTDPDTAGAFVRDYYRICDDGGEVGPVLWEMTAAAGLDPALIKLGPSAAEATGRPQ